MTADERQMWLQWARGLDPLGQGPRPVVYPVVASAPPRIVFAKETA